MQEGIHFVNGEWVFHEHFGEEESEFNMLAKRLSEWERVKTDDGTFMRGPSWDQYKVLNIGDHEKVNDSEGLHQAATYELKKLD